MEVVADIKATNLEGIDAILSVSPCYNKPSQEGIYNHYKIISESTSLPIIVYNVPSRTSSNISDSTIIRLAFDFQNIVAVKEASGNIDQIMKILKNKPADFMVLSGDDGGETYAIAYTCESMKDLHKYQVNFAPMLQQKQTDRYGTKVVAFRTLLEVVSKF